MAGKFQAVLARVKVLAKSGLVLGAFAALLSAGATHWAMGNLFFMTQIEVAIEDFRTAWVLPPEKQDSDIVIIAINEDTLNLFPYRSPIDREFLAKLLHTVAARKPRAIGVDLLFDQPTESGKDAALKEALSTLPVPLFVSYTDSSSIVNAAQLKYLDEFVPASVAVRADVRTNALDGKVRSIFPGAKRPDGSFMPGFARAVAKSQGVETPPVEVDAVWHGRPDADTQPFHTFPAHLVPILPAAWFKDKIVLIGAEESLTDLYSTPFSTKNFGQKSEMPGIEIHAHAVSQLLNHKETQRPALQVQWVLVGLAALLGVGMALFHLSLIWQGAIVTLAVAAFWAGIFEYFRRTGMMMPVVEPTFAFLLASWVGDALTGREARRQKEFVNSAFSRCVNPHLMKELASDPGKLSLGGEAREMTLMFMDIRGFTTISERYDAQGLTKFINRVLTPMTQMVLDNKGTVDKYIGDCIMAFWNAPLTDLAHAENACRAALAMRIELAKLNSVCEAEELALGKTWDPVKIGIGLNTGKCVVGFMGSDMRFDYSVLGDDVNLCSRLEGQSKTYGIDMVIGENTHALVPMMATLELDLIQVKGKTRPVRVHALLGDEQMLESPDFAILRAAHEAVLKAYRAHDWEETRSLLQHYHDIAPPLMQGFANLYDERVEECESNPPPEDWDGVFVAKSK